MFIDPSRWLQSWLHFMLSVELPLPSLLRLWDYYFSDDECLHMHMFVCLGVLQVHTCCCAQTALQRKRCCENHGSRRRHCVLRLYTTG
jgi:hypothetical protein